MLNCHLNLGKISIELVHQHVVNLGLLYLEYLFKLIGVHLASDRIKFFLHFTFHLHLSLNGLDVVFSRLSDSICFFFKLHTRFYCYSFQLLGFFLRFLLILSH